MTKTTAKWRISLLELPQEFDLIIDPREIVLVVLCKFIRHHSPL